MKIVEDTIAIDSETTGLYIHHGCRGFLFTAYDFTGQRFYWEFPVNPFTREITYDQDTVDNMRQTFADYPRWIFHNAVFDLTVLNHVDGGYFDELSKTRFIDDTMLMGHCFNSLREKGLKETAEYYFGYPTDDETFLDDAVKKCQKIASKLGWAIASNQHPHLRPLKRLKHKCDFWIPKELIKRHPEISLPEGYGDRCLTYALNDPERTMGLYLHYKEELESKGTYPNHLKNAKCITAIKDMQDAGFHLKTNRFNDIRRKILNRKKDLLTSMTRIVKDSDYNPASGPQTQEVLYDKLDFPIPKFTKAGNRSVDKECLEILSDLENLTPVQSEFLDSLASYRKLSTAESFLDCYRKFKVGDRLFPFIKIAGTKTLRLACADPNAQNIAKKVPKRFEHLGPIISLRGMFGPPKGHTWLCIDYSQLQLCIFAYACKDNYLIDAFNKGLDIHDTVARKVFRTNNPTSEERTAAKGINFGIIFGAGRAKIERMTGISGSFDEFKRQFPLVDQYIKQQEYLAKDTGFCKTLGGYPLHVPRKTAYKACNYVVQGTEGELVKDAICMTNEYCARDNVVLKPIMVIHDEIIFETKTAIDKETLIQNYSDQIAKIEFLMTEASRKIGVITKVDSKMTDDLWLTAA